MWSGGPHDAKQFKTLAEDWCRNPDESPEGVWCYTLDKEKRWDYCPVRRCSYCDSGYSHTNYRGNHCLNFSEYGFDHMNCQIDNGINYRGYTSTTMGNFKCQAWDVDFPHETNRIGGMAHSCLTLFIIVSITVDLF